MKYLTTVVESETGTPDVTPSANGEIVFQLVTDLKPSVEKLVAALKPPRIRKRLVKG